MRTVLLLTLLLFIACQSREKGFVCGSDLSLLPKHGINGKIIEFDRMAMMDTITTILTGTLLSIETQEALPGGEIELVKDSIKYSGVSDVKGQFGFKHIPSGSYQLRCRYAGYRAYTTDTLTLMSGGIYEISIGLGSKGQDDYD
ncbi:MAG: carboxypeptidase-like regulatory domain-containing protein [Bacteroidia bacterium]